MNSKKPNSSISKEELETLGDKKANLRRDGGADQQLEDRVKPVDFAGKDLDIPGRELPNKHKKTKLVSEENQHFSLGGEDHEDLEKSN